MRYAPAIAGAPLLAGLLTARRARAGEGAVAAPARLDGRSCSVTNADGEAVVVEVGILDADSVERAGQRMLSFEPRTTGAWPWSSPDADTRSRRMPSVPPPIHHRQRPTADLIQTNREAR